jgi:hypothetical protein
MTSKDFGKALGLGITTAVALSLVMVPAFRLGLSPLPKPLGLAFAEVVLGAVPLPVGLLFHLVYVTFWSVLYVLLFPRLTFLNAFWLALALWGLVLLFFFPVVGWGFLGLGVSPKLIIASLVPHMLFAIALWGLCRWAFPGRA